MWKRAALAAALAALLALAAGCTASDTGVDAEPTGDAVDIIVPYATTTISPDATQAPDALLIGSDGQVILNDESVLNGAVATSDAADTTGSKYAQLRLGDTSVAVSNLQTRLQELGYFTEGVSGVFDESTEKAVKLFERSYGIMQTGIATATLQERLFSGDALAYGSDAYNEIVNAQYAKLQKGDVGSNVIALQMRLQELGYPIQEITGVYDDQTVKAVRKFYKMYGYKARDYAIVDLQKVLYSDDAKRYDTDTDTSMDDGATQSPTDPNYGLKSGDAGTRVTQLQLRLVELGYLSGATGTYDQATCDAISQFEIACRLEADGIASEDLQRQLFSEDAPKSGETKQIYALLQWGDSGDAVAKLQARLKELGYYSGEADGVFSDELVAIVKRFQSAAGLDETGVASVHLQELLFSDSAPLSPAKAAEVEEDAAAAEVVISPLMSGDSGDDVVRLQTRLNELGYYSDALDGKFGGGTQKAVEKFQKAVGAQQNGEASADLINLLDSKAAPKSGESYGAAKEYVALKPGDAGDSVIELQRRLWELGYLVKEDIADSIGTYEDITAASVNAVMKVAGFKLRDGRASAEFQAFLFSKAAEGVKK